MDPNEETVMLKLGSLRVTSYSITMGVISAVIAIPVNVLIVILFSKRKMRVQRMKEGESHNTTEKYRVSIKDDKNLSIKDDKNLSIKDDKNLSIKDDKNFFATPEDEDDDEEKKKKINGN